MASKVYVLTNDCMPGIVKIGITGMETVEERIKSLDNTSLPKPFRFYFAIETERAAEIEKFVHKAFDHCRVRANREFFMLDPEEAVAALKVAGAPEIKMSDSMIDDTGAVLNAPKKAVEGKYTSFKEIGIPVGAELTFVRDSSMKCRVQENGTVEYDGKEYSLSGLALVLMEKLGYNWSAVQGTKFFEFQGKTVFDHKMDSQKPSDEDDNTGAEPIVVEG